MIERGRIREIRGNTLTIARENSIACFGCMDRKCKAKGLSYDAENSAGLALRPGQLVETETAASALKQGLAALLPLPTSFIAGYVISGLVFPSASEPFRAAVGVLFLFTAAFAVYFIRRRFPPQTIRRVIRIVS
ncbi:MAG: SoxR reducing system RseC family protein [Treponema sp.]|nr:SoxR reducing system RseC family protein [Treponema sp.]